MEAVIPTTTQNQPDSNPTEPHAAIKLGIDAHAKWFHVARQIDGATPQPVQKMTFEVLLHFVARQKRLARATGDGPAQLSHGVDEVAQLLERLREQGATEAAAALRERFFVRMHDLSVFMRELKQRFYPSFLGLCGLAVA